MEASYPATAGGTGTTLQAAFIRIVTVILLKAVLDVVWDRYLHPLSQYPGPFWRSVSSLPDSFSILRGSAYKDIRALHETYGEVVRVSPNALSYNTAQAWKDIYGFKEDRKELAKDPAFYTRVPGVNIIVANRAEHSRMRKNFQPAFSDNALLEQEPLFNKYYALLISQLQRQIDGPSKGKIDLAAYYNFTTFDIIGDFALGESFGALQAGEYHEWIKNVFESIKLLRLLRFVSSNPVLGIFLRALFLLMPSLRAKRDANLKFVQDKTEARFAQETDRKDFMSYIIPNSDKKGGLSRAEIHSNSRTLIVAGSETIATSLSGTTYFLLTNPVWKQRLQEEVRRTFASPDQITRRSVSTPGALPVLEMVLQESFRCYPPVPSALPRVTDSAGATIDGEFVPAGISVGVHQWSTYRSSKNFASPDVWDPERWTEVDSPLKYQNDNKAALQPFSLGPRGCIGKSLAYFELRSILARMFWHFDMEIDEASWNWLDQKEYALWDKPPLWVKIKHRAASEQEG